MRPLRPSSRNNGGGDDTNPAAALVVLILLLSLGNGFEAAKAPASNFYCSLDTGHTMCKYRPRACTGDKLFRECLAS